MGQRLHSIGVYDGRRGHSTAGRYAAGSCALGSVLRCLSSNAFPVPLLLCSCSPCEAAVIFDSSFRLPLGSLTLQAQYGAIQESMA